MQLVAWGTAALSTLVKSFMRRPRPVAGTDLRVVAADLGGSSFPSGHVLSYVGTYGWLAIGREHAHPAGLAASRSWRLLAGADHAGGSEPHLPGASLGDRRGGVLSPGFSYLAAMVTLYRQLKARRSLS